MASFAYFADLPDGTTLEFRDRRERIGEDRYGAPRYRDLPARVGYFNGSLWGYRQDEAPVKITRTVELKASPSRHECDDRCINATGRVMRCECSCGGKNHGRGRFLCKAA